MSVSRNCIFSNTFPITTIFHPDSNTISELSSLHDGGPNFRQSYRQVCRKALPPSGDMGGDAEYWTGVVSGSGTSRPQTRSDYREDKGSFRMRWVQWWKVETEDNCFSVFYFPDLYGWIASINIRHLKDLIYCTGYDKHKESQFDIVVKTLDWKLGGCDCWSSLRHESYLGDFMPISLLAQQPHTAVVMRNEHYVYYLELYKINMGYIINNS